MGQYNGKITALTEVTTTLTKVTTLAEVTALNRLHNCKQVQRFHSSHMIEIKLVTISINKVTCVRNTNMTNSKMWTPSFLISPTTLKMPNLPNSTHRKPGFNIKINRWSIPHTLTHSFNSSIVHVSTYPQPVSFVRINLNDELWNPLRINGELNGSTRAL